MLMLLGRCQSRTAKPHDLAGSNHQQNPRVTWIKQRQGLFPLDGEVLSIRFVSTGDFDITWSGNLAAAANLIWKILLAAASRNAESLSWMAGDQTATFFFYIHMANCQFTCLHWLKQFENFWPSPVCPSVSSNLQQKTSKEYISGKLN